MKPLETVYWLRLGFGILAAFLAVGFLVIAGAVNTNLVVNPSVEVANVGATAPQNWSSSLGNGTEWSTTYARTGSRSLRIDVTNANANWTGEIEQIYGGHVYHIDGFFNGQVAKGQFLLTVSWLTDSGEIDDNVTLPVVNYGGWQLEGGTFTAPSGAKSCKIVFRTVNGSGDLYGDDFDFRQTEPIQSFFNSASIAILVYIVSYYVLKSRFGPKVSKPQKILTTGIGIYILAWLVIWALLYTLVAGV